MFGIETSIIKSHFLRRNYTLQYSTQIVTKIRGDGLVKCSEKTSNRHIFAAKNGTCTFVFREVFQSSAFLVQKLKQGSSDTSKQKFCTNVYINLTISLKSLWNATPKASWHTLFCAIWYKICLLHITICPIRTAAVVTTKTSTRKECKTKEPSSMWWSLLR